MKHKKSISVSKVGMDRDNHISNLKNTQYTLGININSSSESGDIFTVQNEPSNYLGLIFPNTYKVIGFKNDIISNYTYFFLTSTETDINNVNYKRSSIGYVNNNILEAYNQDQECTNCNDPKNVLGTPLEEIIQTPSQNYIELVHDRCVSLADIEEKGLNFNINFPIKKIDIKQEKLGTNLYWNDWRNPFRYLQIGKIKEAYDNETFDYLHSEDIACGDPQQTPCLNVDKLLVSPKHSKIILDADKEQIGGNLKQGTYEFWSAYCDIYGNELTEYSTPTNPISIWDENNYIQSQTDTDDFTNYAIKLKVRNLESKKFKYYKIAVVERNNVNATQSVFLAGIYPTTDNIVLYTHSSSNNDDLYITRGNISIKKRMDFNTLLALKPQYKRMKGTMVSDDRLFSFGLEEEEEINIQPVVNLFSSLVKAQTSAVSENLYKSAIATSKYKAYPRGEVQPFSIRLIYNDGGYSANFPFIGRPKTEYDSEVIPDNDKNKISLLQRDSACISNSRNERWQIFNTASLLNSEDCFDLEANSIQLPPEEVKKTCSVDIATYIPDDSITLELEDTFYDLESYINTHISDICNMSSPFYNSLLCSYLDDNYSETCQPSYVGDCNSPILQTSKNLIKEVINEQKVFNYKTDIEYQKSVPPKYCNQFSINISDGNYTQDTPFMDLYSPCYPLPTFPITYARKPVYFRDSDFQNETCSYAQDIMLQTNPSQSYSSIVLNYQASSTISDLVNNNTLFPTTTYTGFHSNLHNKAQFFKVEKNNRNNIVLEITRKNNCQGTGDLYEMLDNTIIRYSIYDDCTSPTLLFSNLVDLNNGELITLDISSYPSTFIVAIDTKIISVPINCPPDPPLLTFHLAPPCACFGLYIREQEKKSVTVTWDRINLKKELEYKATCNFTLPKVNDCDPIPYKKYKMAYWESVITYPDNKELYDSSTLFIKPTDLNILSISDKEDFENYFTNGLDTNGNYFLKEDTDFRCKPIRHPKLPDNTIAPFIIDNISHKENAESVIFPLGINFDSNIVETMIQVAYNNGLITKKQRNKITGWEILRGDNSIHKSSIMNGILYDVYNYTKNNQLINFSNFPFNDLGQNKFVRNPIDDNLINHPYGGIKNNKFTFISPDAFLTKPQIPTEMSLQGYLLGSADIGFADVKQHPQWTILGSDAYNLAEILAIAELALELAVKIAEFTTQSGIGNSWFIAGLSTGTNVTGSIASGVAIGVFIGANAIQSFIKYGEYRYRWLEIFTNLGRLENFASFQYGVGKHNKFLKPEDNNNYVRGLSLKKHLRDGNFSFLDEVNGETIKMNHYLRENSVLLSLGNSYLEYPNEYINYDNNIRNSKSSNFLASETGCATGTYKRDVANPYVSLRNYVPDQWDTIDSIKWLTTNYIFDRTEDTSCKVIYGGTTTISRFSWRIKVPFYTDNAIKIADKIPYKYSKNSNIGKTRFFCDYETADDDTFDFLGVVFPEKSSNYEFDCIAGKNDFYLKSPSKFYLYTHGIIDFLVESEINCNFRYGKKEPKDQFYNNQAISEWLQEVNLPIVEPNTFYYNNSYTFPVSNTPYKTLDRNYNKKDWKKRALKSNAWIWSEKDNNENNDIDPWLSFRPLNFWEDKTNRGELIDLRSIESEQFLGRYEDQLQLYNQSNNVADAITNQNKELGTGFLYSRPVNFKKSDLGFAGTQNTDFVSTPYGHFWVDAKRGRIFQVDQNGGNLEVISENVQGNPTNMKQWFREHLPFKILKFLPDIDTDNKFKGIGINMWYDDRNSRIFITKRDYVLNQGINKNSFFYDKTEQKLKYNNTEVFFDNTTLFKDVSWTISFKPSEGTWNSFFTFYPDYSPYQQNYFQVGYNFGKYKETCWNHLLNNNSFCVFQGEYNPWVLEFPIANENANKILNSIAINIESKRYINQYDYSVHKNIGITDMFIYNQTNNTGYLVLHPQKSLLDNKNYPKTINNKQEIITTFNDGYQNINYFFNRVVNQDSNIPMFKKDENNIFKDIDRRAVKFGDKKVLERITGEVFIVNLSNTQDSRFNILIKSIINNETVK